MARKRLHWTQTPKGREHMQQLALRKRAQTRIEEPANAAANAAPENLCLFFASGRTFTFNQVTVLHDNENGITFRYVAQSDGRSKTATFSKWHVVGVSRFV